MSNWTKKEVLKEHTLAVIILTFTLTMAFSNILNRLLLEVTILGSRLYSAETAEYLPGVFALVLWIPLGYSSILLVRYFLDKQNIYPNPTYKWGPIKWYSFYGKVFGFILFVLLTDFTSELLFDDYGDFTALFFSFFVVGLPILSGFLLNIIMIFLTKTNKELITKIRSGTYDEGFADMNEKQRVIKKLKRGRASTIKGAITHIKFTDNLKIIAFCVVVVPISFIFSGRSNSTRQGAGASYSNSNVAGLKRKFKNDADTIVKQKQQQADFSQNKFAKQYAYNSKYSETDYNHAKRAEAELQQAKRDADSFK